MPLLPDRRNERAEYPYCQGRAYPSDHFRERVYGALSGSALRIFGVGRPASSRSVSPLARRIVRMRSSEKEFLFGEDFQGVVEAQTLRFGPVVIAVAEHFVASGDQGFVASSGHVVCFSRMKQCHCRPEESGDRRKSKNRERMGARFGKREGRVCKYTLTKRRSQEVVVFLNFRIKYYSYICTRKRYPYVFRSVRSNRESGANPEQCSLL